MYKKYDVTYSEAQYRVQMLNMIRREKFDYILPNAMKNNNVDMLIHIIRRGSNDPLSIDMGAGHGVFVFTDIGTDRVERAIFGHVFTSISDETVYDYFGSACNMDKLYEHDVLSVGDEIREYIEQYDPKSIAINMSEDMSMIDSLSYYGFLKLKNILGEKYSDRLMSSEKVIGDFRANRTNTELVFYSRICEIQRKIVEKGLEKIKPGCTTMEEIKLYGEAKLLEWNLHPDDVSMIGPEVEKANIDGVIEEGDQYVFEQGDLIFWDWGFERINLNYGTDFKRTAYILKDGETELPEGIQNAWDNLIKFREIAKKSLKCGITGKEAMDKLIENAKKLGFKHMPFISGPEDVLDEIKKLDKSEVVFNVDFHTIGNAGTDFEVGTPIAPQRPYRSDEIIRENQLNAFEFFITQWIPEMNKWQIINHEDDLVLTRHGAQYIYPCQDKVILIK